MISEDLAGVQQDNVDDRCAKCLRSLLRSTCDVEMRL